MITWSVWCAITFLAVSHISDLLLNAGVYLNTSNHGTTLTPWSLLLLFLPDSPPQLCKQLQLSQLIDSRFPPYPFTLSERPPTQLAFCLFCLLFKHWTFVIFSCSSLVISMSWFLRGLVIVCPFTELYLFIPSFGWLKSWLMFTFGSLQFYNWWIW